MVAPQLRALATAATGHGTLSGPGTGSGRAEHPVCGDEVEVFVRADGDRIADLRWRAHGCPATFAVAATAAVALPGGAIAAAAQRLRRELAGRGDLAAAERHAEAMFVRALQQAIAAAGGG